MKRTPTKKQQEYYDRMRETGGWQAIGRKGGRNNVLKHGPEHMSRLGQLGYQGLVKAKGGEAAVKAHLSAMGKIKGRKGATDE